jgi:hypothetical protein
MKVLWSLFLPLLKLVAELIGEKKFNDVCTKTFEPHDRVVHAAFAAAGFAAYGERLLCCRAINFLLTQLLQTRLLHQGAWC